MSSLGLENSQWPLPHKCFNALYLALKRVRVILKHRVMQLAREMYVHIVPFLSVEPSWDRARASDSSISIRAKY